MKRLMALAVKLYPSAWRERYEVEFQALLDEVEPSWRASFDVFSGGLVMRLRTLNAAKASLLVLTLAVAGSLVGLATASGMTRQYQSTSVVLAPLEWGTSREDVARVVQSKTQDLLSREKMIKLIIRYGLYPSEMARNPIDPVIEKMREAIKIAPVVLVSNQAKQANQAKSLIGFTIQFRYPKPVFAQAVVQDLTRDFDGQLLDPASLPTKAVLPKTPKLVCAGLAGGLLLGSVVLLVRRFGTA